VKQLGLTTRMALAVSILFIVFVVTMASLTLSFLEKEFKGELARHQFALASSLSDSIDEKLGIVQAALMAAATKVPPDDLHDADRAQQFLNDRVTLRAIFGNEILLLSKDGKLIAESPFQPNRRGRDFSSREFYRETATTGKPVISRPFPSGTIQSHPEIMFTAPIFDKNGRIAAILGGSIDLLDKNFLADLPRIKIGASGYLSIHSSDRTVIMHTDIGKIMKKGSPSGADSLFDRSLAGFEGSGETVDASGADIIASHKHLRLADWVLAVNYPVAEAYAPLQKARYLIILATVAGTAALLFMVWFLMERLTSSLLTITRHVQELPGKTGEEKLISVDEQGEIGILAQAFNGMVTDLESQQKALRESEHKYRIVADNTYDWEFWLGPDGRFIYTSPSCKRVTGHDVEEFDDDPDLLGRLIHPEDQPLFEDHRHDITRTGHSGELEFRIIRPDGAIRWIHHLCQPIFAENGDFLGTRGNNRDITERKRAEEVIRSLNTDLQGRATELAAINQELASFGYTLSHDLKTPLTAVYLAAQELTEMYVDQLDETGSFFVASICKSSERMVDLIDAMLQLARVSQSVIQHEETNLSGLAKKILLRLQMEHPERKVECVVAPKITARGDARLLESALENLLGNAWKYTRKLPEARIEFGTAVQDGEKRHYVRDNGAGFSMEQAEKLFLPFSRLHRPEEFEGSGIGLATVQRIVQRHGGRIWAESEPGRGATLYFTLDDNGSARP
jgi:PAS domain S-box-containing protein